MGNNSGHKPGQDTNQQRPQTPNTTAQGQGQKPTTFNQPQRPNSPEQHGQGNRPNNNPNGSRR